MKHAILVLLVLLSAPALAGGVVCYSVKCQTQSEDSSGCWVPSKKNLIAKLPAGLNISSIQGGTRFSRNHGFWAKTCQEVRSLPATFSLDDGDFYGVIQVSGNYRASGEIVYEPHEGGEYVFRPDVKFLKGSGRFFRSKFESIKLDGANPEDQLKPPRSLADKDCWVAQATIEASDFEIIVVDSSAEGTYVKRMRLTNVRGFAPC